MTPRQLISIAVGIVVGASVGALMFRTMRASLSLMSDNLSRARLRRVNVCFALFGILVLGALWALAQPWEQRQGASALVGMFLGVPLVCLAGPVALYNSVLLWRVRSVRTLWTCGLVFAVVVLAEETLGPSLSVVLELSCGLATFVLAILGLIEGRVKDSHTAGAV